MARKDKLEAALQRLAEVARQPEAAGAEETLRDALAGKLPSAAARAAEIAGEMSCDGLIPDLVHAFQRFLQNPVKSDPGCLAKTAIAEALHQLDAREEAVYLAGARHVQMEPVYGGRQDTAAPLRGASARGLVRMNHPDALLVLAELLADPELPARIAAARTVAYHGGAAGLPLLRLKSLEGDREPEVVGECLLAMLRIAPDESTPFVERFLDGSDRVLAEAASLALGESRAPAALAALQAWWKRTTDADLSRSALLAIAMQRSDAAIAWLLDLIRREPGPVARDAIGAFEVYRSEEAMVKRVRKVALARDDVDLGRHVEDVLG